MLMACKIMCEPFIVYTRVVMGSLGDMYRLFNVSCYLWNIYKGAELPSVYFITNSKHCTCITYLAPTQLFPGLLTRMFHIVKYTHYGAFD